MSGNEALKVNACLVFLSTLLRIAERLAAEQLLLIPQDFSVTPDSYERRREETVLCAVHKDDSDVN